MERPNILLILADDLGNNDLGSFGDGGIATPNIDALAAGGVRFTRHYAHATCRPSRLALLTGMPASRSGVPPYFRGIPPELTILPEALQQAGYTTHHIGKWHLGRSLPSSQPDRQGFDRWFGFLTALALRNGSLDRPGISYSNPFLQANDEAPRKHKGHLTDLLTNEAIATIEASADGDNPWFINLWYFAPHTPIQPAGRFAARFPDTAEGRFQALVTQLDTAIGRLLDALQRSGQLNDTLVVFASDNGGLNKFRNNNAPYFGAKNSFTEGGLRTPLVLYMPGRLPTGSIAEPVFITDLMPTILSIAGTPIPAYVEGRDLGPLLQGGTVAPVERYFWDIQAVADVQYGELDLGKHLLVGPGYYQSWSPDNDRFGEPQAVPDGIAAVSAVEYAQWRRRARSVDPDTDSYRRTPGYGAWTLQATLNGEPDRSGTIEQPGQFTLSVQGGQLTVSMPGHHFTVDIPTGTPALLTLSSYYSWSEFRASDSNATVALFLDEQEIYRRNLPISDDILLDDYPSIRITGPWQGLRVVNDFLERGLVEEYNQATGNILQGGAKDLPEF